MRRVFMAAFALVIAAGGLAAQERVTAEERQQMEQQLRQLRERMRDLQTQMRDLEGKLGRGSSLWVVPEVRLFGDSVRWAAPLTVSIMTDRPRLGVVVKTVTDPATDSVGAVLQAVTPDGPAAEAGLLAGDVVVSFNGKKLGVTGKAEVSPGDHLIELAQDLDEGDSVRVQYRRGRETKTVVIVPRKLDSSSYSYSYVVPDVSGRLDMTRERLDAVRSAQERALRLAELGTDSLRGTLSHVYFGQFGSRWSDMELTTLDTALGTYFGTTEGLLVVRAPKDSLLGLKSGDVILRIGGRVPSTPSQAIRILRTYEPGDEIRIDIMRNKRRTEVTATVPERDRGLFWDEQLH
jgi:membrane-associated protease RseP (regulator of RpoE activity)